MQGTEKRMEGTRRRKLATKILEDDSTLFIIEKIDPLLSYSGLYGLLSCFAIGLGEELLFRGVVILHTVVDLPVSQDHFNHASINSLTSKST